MAGHLVAPSSFINLQILNDHASKRLYVPGSQRLRIAQRKSRGSCNILRPSTRRSYRLAAPSLLNEKAGFRESLSRFTCLASFADLNRVAAFEWVPIGDQVLLMASIFLTYMAGVISVPKSNYSPRKNISEKNQDIGGPASTGSAKGNDFEGDLNGAWEVVKGKILESIDAIESGSTLGGRVGNPEKPRGKAPLSLYAISERPKLWLLLACFQQLEEEANSFSDFVSTDDWVTAFAGIIQRACKPACIAWLKQEFDQENNDSSESIASLMIRKLDEDDTIMQKIRKSGKEDLYAEFLYFLKFGTDRKPSCYDPCLFQLHGISLLEDLVITIADGISGTYLELISVDGNLPTETPSRAIDICNLSSRELQKLRNEVALYQWLYQNLEAVASMYEDRFDLYTFESQVVAKPRSDKPSNGSWWKKLTMGKSEAVTSLRYAVISHFSMPVKRTRELRALTGWRYYFSLFLELSDIGMPIVRVVVDKISGAISFFLVSLIGRSLGLIYTGIRQSLRWK